MAKAPKKKNTKKNIIIKHKKLLRKITDNIRGGMNMQEAMSAVGYSESYAKSSTHLKDTDSWQTLVNENLSNEVLMEKHIALLNKKSIDFQIFPKSMSNESIEGIIKSFGFKLMQIVQYENWKRAYFPILDIQAIKAALDMAYKISKKYGDITITHKLGSLSDEEIEGEITGALSEAIGSIAGATKKKGK